MILRLSDRYDNEYGYSSRVVELVKHMYEVDHHQIPQETTAERRTNPNLR